LFSPVRHFCTYNYEVTPGGLKCERHLIDEAERQAKRSGKRGKKGISSASIKEMEQKLKLI
jgi:hypothetical protein